MTADLRLFWEALPLMAALAAILICGHRGLITTAKTVRVQSALAVACAVLLVVAQSSWAWTLIVQRMSVGTGVADLVWTFFNTAVMVTFIYSAAGEET